MQQGTQGTPNRSQIIGIIIVIVIAAVVLLPRLFGNNSTPTQTIPSVPQQQNQNPANDNANVQLGAPVAAVGVDRNGCATDTTGNFSPNDNIYVVAPNSNVPAGTSIFVRLYRDNNAIEDAPEIRADKDYVKNCVNFVFSPTGQSFAPGTYEAQFYVNGNAGPSVTFNVQ